MLSSMPAAAATAVAQRSQGGKQSKSIPPVKYTQKKKFDSLEMNVQPYRTQKVYTVSVRP